MRTACLTAILSTLFFAVLALSVDDDGALDQWEEKWLPALHALRSHFWTVVMHGIDAIYDPFLAIWLLSSTAFLMWKRSWDRLGLLCAIAMGGGLLARLTKELIERDRPEVVRLIGAGGHSFPSGHVFGIALFAAWAIFAVLELPLPQRTRWVCMAVIGLSVVAVASSRVYLGAHYASDVLGSILGATAWTSCCVAGYLLARSKRRSTP